MRAQLSLFGTAQPRPLAQWSAGASAAQPALPDDLVELIVQWGPGRLAATFAIPDPAGDAWAVLHDRALALHSRGWWAGLDREAFEELVVFARDRRGAGLAWGAGEFVFLGPRGEVLRVGHTLDELVTGFLCASLHLTYDLRVANELGRFVELGAEPVYVAAAAPGLREYLDGLRAGRDDLLEAALSAEPLVLAYVDTIAALCSPAADDIAEPTRADALDSLLALARRRAPMIFGLLIPDGVRRERPFADQSVRSWAQRASSTREEGPLFADPPAGTQIDVPAQLRPVAYWPTPNVEPWLASIVERWRGSPLEPAATQLVQQARALAPGFAHSVLRQIEQLDGFRTHVHSGSAGALAFDVAQERADSAEERVRAVRAEALPLIALASLSDREAVCVRAVRLLRGVRDAALFDLCLRLIVCTMPPMPWGADACTLAEVAIAAGPIDDTLVPHLLGAMQVGSPIAAILVSPRVERDDVHSAFLEHYTAIATAGAWSPNAHARQHLTEDDALVVDALCAFLNVAKPPRRSLSEQGFRADGADGCVAPPYFCENGLSSVPRPAIAQSPTAPHRPGPLGPITQALLKRPEKRTLDTLRRVALNKRAPIDTRDEAAKGLVAFKSPDAAEVKADVARAWERHWRI